MRCRKLQNRQALLCLSLLPHGTLSSLAPRFPSTPHFLLPPDSVSRLWACAYALSAILQETFADPAALRKAEEEEEAKELEERISLLELTLQLLAAEEAAGKEEHGSNRLQVCVASV